MMRTQVLTLGQEWPKAGENHGLFLGWICPASVGLHRPLAEE